MRKKKKRRDLGGPKAALVIFNYLKFEIDYELFIADKKSSDPSHKIYSKTKIESKSNNLAFFTT